MHFTCNFGGGRTLWKGVGTISVDWNPGYEKETTFELGTVLAVETKGAIVWRLRTEILPSSASEGPGLNPSNLKDDDWPIIGFSKDENRPEKLE